MLSALIKLTSPYHDSDSYGRLSKLLLTPKNSVVVENHSVFSVVDNEFDIQLNAAFDDNGIVTDLLLED